MHSCIFCKVAEHAAPAKIVYEDDQVVAFQDIRPVAPVHVLIIPRKHIPTLNEVTVADHPVIGQLFLTARNLAEQFGIHQRGYRTVFNCNDDAGQTVYHLHLHLIGGRVLSWP
jgi:histidine triad (HIT) family protein